MSDQLTGWETEYFPTPNNVFLLEGFSNNEKLVYIYLCRCKNNGRVPFPSYNDIGKKCSLSRRTSISVVESLVEKGLIRKTKRIDEEKDRNTSNLYTLIHPSEIIAPPLVQPLHHPSATIAPYKEVLKNKDLEKEKPLSSNNDSIVSQVIDYLNEKTGKRFSDKTKETARLISGRVKSGATLKDFKHVIDVKVAKWIKDERMKDYLKPDTLFNEKNFEAYRQESMPSEASYLRPGSSGVKNENLEETEAFESAYGQLFKNS